MTRRLFAASVSILLISGLFPAPPSRRAGADPATAPATAPASATTTAVAASAPSPATAPAVPREVALLVASLGDDDPQVRDAASRRLAALGKATLPALREAAAGDDPEIAGRARRLMTGFRYGIGPDTPADVLERVNQYRSGQPPQRSQAVQALGNLGWPGYRVLAKLRRQETDADWRAALAGPLRNGAEGVITAARQLLLTGNEERAEAMLGEAADGGDSLVARGYAALLLSRDRLEQARRDLEVEAGEAPGPDDALLLAWMARARGDGDAVLRYAARVGARAGSPRDVGPELTREVLLDRHDWPGLIEMATRRVEESTRAAEANAAPNADANATGNPAERRSALAEQAAYARLAGRKRVFDDAVAALRQSAGQDPAQAAACADALLLNDRFADGLSLLARGKAYLPGFHLLSAQGRHPEAERLVDAARADPAAAPGLPGLELTAARASASLGDREQAGAVVDRIAGEVEAGKVTGVEGELIRAELALGRNDKAFGRAAALLASPAWQNNVPGVMANLVPGFPEQAARWRVFLVEQHPAAPQAEVLAKVWGLFARKLPAGETESLLNEAAEDAAAPRVPAQRDPWMAAVADAARAVGREDLADAVYEKMAAVSGGWFPWKRLGDRAARRRDWTRAAECYRNALRKDPSEPVCLWLRGWASLRAGAGSTAAARADMQRAGELLLGDGQRRLNFTRSIAEAGADDTGDVEPHRELLRRLGEPGSWEVNESFHDSARALLTAGRHDADAEDPLEEQAGAGGNAAAARYLRAADLMSRWLLPMTYGGTVFLQPESYLSQPAVVHVTRARGLIESGDVAGAVREADLALTALPANTQIPIDLVPALDRHGHRAEADALFRSVAAASEASIGRYPHCAELHNGFAWMSARCDRELDKGLEHARQATTLAPDSVAYLDTLAEVHFHRGERQAAVDTMKRCIELDPHFEYLREQMKRFTAAAGPETKPGGAPGR